MSVQDMTPQGRYVVPALAQGLSLLALFSRERSVLTAPEIAQELSLSRTTVFRLLHTLQLMGYVNRDDDDRRYKLGPAVLSRGFAYVSSLDSVEIATPILQRLRDDTAMSAHMAVRDAQEVVYVARFAAHTTVSSSVQIGTRFPVHATVMGRMLIIEFTDEELRTLFPRDPLPRFSEQTPTTLKQLKTFLAEDRERGYAVSQSFFERGVTSIAAPVRDGSGKIIASINATAVDAYVDMAELHGPLKDRVVAAASEISARLAQSQPSPAPVHRPRIRAAG